MARYFVTAALLLMASCAPHTEAALNASQVSASIKSMTTLSSKLITTANTITPVNTALFIAGQGPYPAVISGLKRIVDTATVLAKNFGAPTYSKADSTALYASYRTFVGVHQQLLDVLINKASLLTQAPFIGGPVADVLKTVDAIMDTIAVSLVNACPTQATNFQTSAASLKVKLTTAIMTYSGIAGGAPNGIAG